MEFTQARVCTCRAGVDAASIAEPVDFESLNIIYIAAAAAAAGKLAT